MSFILGVTGPSGAGKSLFCKAFADRGYKVLDCDEIYAGLVAGPSACMVEIAAHFGPSAVNPDCSLNRKNVAAAVFAKDGTERLALLNAITHKYVLAEIKKEISTSDAPGFVVDAPLLFQSGFDAECCATVAVLAPYGTRLSRLLSRDGASEEAIRARMDAAPDDVWYVRKCTWTVFNSGSPEAMVKAAGDILRELDCR